MCFRLTYTWRLFVENVPVKFGEPFVFEAREVMTFVGSFRKEVNRTKMLDFFVTVESWEDLQLRAEVGLRWGPWYRHVVVPIYLHLKKSWSKTHLEFSALFYKNPFTRQMCLPNRFWNVLSKPTRILQLNRKPTNSFYAIFLFLPFTSTNIWRISSMIMVFPIMIIKWDISFSYYAFINKERFSPSIF